MFCSYPKATLGALQIGLSDNAIQVKTDQYCYGRRDRLTTLYAAGSALVDAETPPELGLGFVSGQA